MNMYAELLGKVKDLAQEAAAVAKLEHAHTILQKGKQDFVTDVDLAISTFLCDHLPQLLPGSAVISEEGYKGEPGDGYYWVIDPIDGTNNFIYQLPNFAISIGLLRDRKPVLGVISAPRMGELYVAALGEGATCNGAPIHVCPDETVAHTLVLAETNPYSDRAANRFPALVRNVYLDCIDCRFAGTAALDCCYVACGRGGVFIAENVKPWDYTAGEIITTEAGGRVTQWNGAPMSHFGNTSILLTNGTLHEEMLERIRQIFGPEA